MAQHAVAESIDDPVAPIAPTAPAPDDGAGSPRPRRRAWKVVAMVAGTVLVLVAIAVLWFFLGRDRASELTDSQALTDFRAAAGETSGSEALGRPRAGVYAATATGSESIGLPGFDEQVGPNAPVTVTHGDDGCYTFRTDLNSHHWRSWTFCPTQSARFALVRLDSSTERRAPGLDIATITTYRCATPLDFSWDGAAPGDVRRGACEGTSDMDDSITEDAAQAEVVATGSRTVAGVRRDAVHVRTSDAFSGAQTGYERGDWWLDAETGLPLAVSIEAELEGGPSTYAETLDLVLSTLQPAT